VSGTASIRSVRCSDRLSLKYRSLAGRAASFAHRTADPGIAPHAARKTVVVAHVLSNVRFLRT